MRATDATVLVAGSGNPTGHGVVQALHGVCRVVGYDSCEASDNPANLWCDNVQVPPAADAGYWDAVCGLVERHRPIAVIPSNDHDLSSLAYIADVLEGKGVVVNGLGPSTLDLLDKRATSRLFTRHGIRTPELLEGGPGHEPYVVRKSRAGHGKKFTCVVKDARARLVLPAGSDDRVVTRYVEGDEFTIDVLCDGSSNALSVVPRLRREVRYGMVHRGEVVRDELVIARTRELAERVRLVGVNCVQCIRTHADAWFFEVNCRPGSGSSLTTAAGVNMPTLWVKMLLGEPIAVPEPAWGTKMTRFFDGYYHT